MACPICLRDCENPTKLDGCFHTFCFLCAIQWAKVTPTNPLCPLCKAPFVSVIHSHDPISKEYKRLFLTPETLLTFDGSSPPTTKSFGASWRKEIYEHKLQPNPTFQTQPFPFPKRERERLTPQLQRARQAIDQKFDGWVQRELSFLLYQQVLDERDQAEATEEIEIISYRMKFFLEKFGDFNRPEVHQYLECYLFENTSQFLSELTLFLQSPYTMKQFDEEVEYVCQIEVDDEEDSNLNKSISV